MYSLIFYALFSSCETFCILHTPQGWQLSLAAKQHPIVFQALLKVAFETFYMPRCIGGRIGRGSANTKGMIDTDASVLVWWPVNQPQLYKSMMCHGELSLNLRELFGDSWRDTAWIRLFSVEQENVAPVRRVVDDVPMLAEDPPEQVAAIPLDIDDTTMPDASSRDNTSIMSTEDRHNHHHNHREQQDNEYLQLLKDHDPATHHHHIIHIKDQTNQPTHNEQFHPY